MGEGEGAPMGKEECRRERRRRSAGGGEGGASPLALNTGQ